MEQKSEYERFEVFGAVKLRQHPRPICNQTSAAKSPCVPIYSMACCRACSAEWHRNTEGPDRAA